MRKLVLPPYLLLTALMFASCNKDKTAEDDIVGSWAMKSSKFTTMVGDKTLNKYFTDIMGLSASDALTYENLFNVVMQQNFSGTVQIRSDKTYTSTLGGQNDSGTWSLSSDRKQLTIDPATDPPVIFDIVSLSTNELILHIREAGSYDLNGDNTQEAIMLDAEITFGKQ